MQLKTFEKNSESRLTCHEGSLYLTPIDADIESVVTDLDEQSRDYTTASTHGCVIAWRKLPQRFGGPCERMLSLPAPKQLLPE
jgi:hypothetical protein